MDWVLLREQKQYCVNEAANNNECSDIYTGIAHLMDWIQGAAIAAGYATKDEVFGITDEGLAYREAIKKAAQRIYRNGDIQIDAFTSADFEEAGNGCWVRALLYVTNEEAGVE